MKTFILCLHSLIQTLEGLGEFLTVMQTLDFVSGLHDSLKFFQPLECLYQAMQTQEKSFLLLKYFFFFQKNTVTLPFTSNLFVNVKFHNA